MESKGTSSADEPALVWEKVCRHIGGVGVGSTVAALAAKGVFELLARNPGLSMEEVHRQTGGGKGYLHVAFRLLACEGWLVREGEPASDDMRFQLTPAGLELRFAAPHYGEALTFFARAPAPARESTPEGRRHRALYYRAAAERMRNAWDLADGNIPPSLLRQVRDHLDGHVLTPLLAHLALHGPWPQDSEAAEDPSAGDHPLAGAGVREILEGLNWIHRDEAGVAMTAAGAIAMACARQYWYPMSYRRAHRGLHLHLRAARRLPGAAPEDSRAGSNSRDHDGRRQLRDGDGRRHAPPFSLGRLCRFRGGGRAHRQPLQAGPGTWRGYSDHAVAPWRARAAPSLG
ncbi:MAG TPA: hypothetical protein VGO11_12180 [Chthoniobacteraceae bacterium]|jgi:hypothetical protein|nr:hypothetical protein [Chthoniobacteraceae bacterium]